MAEAPRSHENVSASDALGDALEERLSVGHDVLGLEQLHEVLELGEEPGLLGGVSVGPVLEERGDDLRGRSETVLRAG